MADELLERSFSGKKTATVPVVPESEPVPKAGGLSLVLDGKGEPACVIRKVSIEGIPYGSLTWDKIRLKGEDEIELALYADGNGNKL